MKKTMYGTPLIMINITNINESLNKYWRIMNRASLYNPIKISSNLESHQKGKLFINDKILGTIIIHNPIPLPPPFLSNSNALIISI